MNKIDRMVRVAGLIMIGAALAAIVASAALAQEPGLMTGPADNGNGQTSNNVVAPPPLKSFSLTGSSTNGVDTGTTCPDLICSNGNACSCNEANGSAASTLLGKVSYSVEISADSRTPLLTGQQFNDTLAGPTFCEACSGLITLTFGSKKKPNTANLDTSGLICVTVHGQILYNGSFLVLNGGGAYSNAFGGGTVAWTLTTPAAGGINNQLVLNGLLAK